MHGGVGGGGPQSAPRPLQLCMSPLLSVGSRTPQGWGYLSPAVGERPLSQWVSLLLSDEFGISQSRVSSLLSIGCLLSSAMTKSGTFSHDCPLSSVVGQGPLHHGCPLSSDLSEEPFDSGCPLSSVMERIRRDQSDISSPLAKKKVKLSSGIIKKETKTKPQQKIHPILLLNKSWVKPPLISCPWFCFSHHKSLRTETACMGPQDCLGARVTFM